MTEIAARNRRNKRAGARWEAELRDKLRGAGLDIERLRLAGAEDEGDHVIRREPVRHRRYLITETKNAKFEPGAFVKEALRERDNFAAHRGLDPRDVEVVTIVRRRGASWRHAYVLSTVQEFFDLPPEPA
ncbi:hypothetical protein ACH5AU_23890 [Streptomyces albidoflavus]